MQNRIPHNIISDQGHILSIEPRPQGDIALRMHPSFDDLRDDDTHECVLSLVPKWREQSVSAVFYNTVSAISDSKSVDLEGAESCLPFIPQDKKVSIKCFDYLPTLTGCLRQGNTPELIVNSHDATQGWSWNKFELSMTFSRTISGKDYPNMGVFLNPSDLYPLILAMHIAQKPDADQILLEEINYEDDVFAHLPILAQRLKIK